MEKRESKYVEKSSDEGNAKTAFDGISSSSYGNRNVWSSIGRALATATSYGLLLNNTVGYGHLETGSLAGAEDYKIMKVGRREFVIVGGVIVAALAGGALYYFNPGFRSLINRFIDRTPPEIKDLKWEATKVVNDRVYDGTLSFTAEDRDSLIAEAYMELNPSVPPEIPSQAFPAEDPRRIQLTPMNIVFDSKTASFSQDITGLKGGKGYQIKVKAKDAAGNESKDSKYNPNERSGSILDIPYVREFENITETSDLNIGANYIWNYSEKWDSLRHNDTSLVDIPMLGLYDNGSENSVSDFVRSKQIDDATGHGIKIFFCNWDGPSDVRPQRLLSNYLAKDVRVAIEYQTISQNGDERLKRILLPNKENVFGNSTFINLDDIQNRAVLKSDFEFMTNNLFSHPSYLRIEGAPVVYYYLSKLFIGDTKSAIGELRDIAQDHGYKVFIIGDEVYWHSAESANPEILRLYNAITPYDMVPTAKYLSVLSDFETKLDQKTQEWSEMARKLGIHFVPYATPGYYPIAIRPEELDRVVPRSVPKFRTRLEIAQKHMDPEIKLVHITTFDDWFEFTCVERGKKYGLDYLNPVKDVFFGSN